ncbi:unnamed protein product [Knipowitschia caucasica]|uniref:Dendritic cell-specific transmembrane protein-like domain-containing protein n=1 Tax=Knipowitschia caucasica TaxID=637954 RepID=A0AAV2MSV7_KNICA
MTVITVELSVSGEVKRREKGVLRQLVVRRWRVGSILSSVISSLISSSTLSSLIGFSSGLLFSLLFGSMLLFLQKIPVWTCAYMMAVVTGVSCFGMGLSQTIRADAAVMVPSLCSGHGRKLIYFFLVSVVVSGPITNSLHNTELVGSSLLCSAELTANQTQELLRKAASPLSAMLDNLREISNNAYRTAGRIQNLINALTDNVRHIAWTLRNRLHFLVDIGDICNEEMGAPYKKCRQLFEKATLDCKELLGDFDFLCEVVDGFLPLCKLAKAGELFCVIPSYVAEQLKSRLAAPVVSALEKLKQEFDFDLDASVTFDVEVNSSQSLEEVTQQILEEVSSKFHLFEMFNQPLKYITVLFLLWTYYKAARYRRKYLRNLDFDNIYINNAFKELDHRVTSGGGTSVLPITAWESRVYISPFSFQLSNQEKCTILKALSSWLRNVLIAGICVALDFLIFWILEQVQHQASSDIIARPPVQIQVTVNGTGFAADIYRDLVHSFQILQTHNLTVFSRACVVQPRQPDVSTNVTIGFLLGLAFLLAVCQGFIQRTRRVICSWFHPQQEKKRLLHFRSRIIDQRRWEKNALRSLFLRALPIQDIGRIQSRLSRFPGVSRLLKALGWAKTRCMSCEESFNTEAVVKCETCSAVYCGGCLLNRTKICLGCGEPLTSQDDDAGDVSDLGSSSEDESEQGLGQMILLQEFEVEIEQNQEIGNEANTKQEKEEAKKEELKKTKEEEQEELFEDALDEDWLDLL